MASQERKGLHLQNKDSSWEAGIGDEVTGSQCSGDSLLCRGEPLWMPQSGVMCSGQTVPAVPLACEGLRVSFSPAWKTGPYLLCWEVRMVPPARDPCSLPIVDTGSQVTGWYRKSSVPNKALGMLLKDCFNQWHR